MKDASFHRYRAVPACRSLALAGAFVAATSIAHATTYDEGTQGDLSNDPAAPTNIGSLTPGSNTIAGATIPSGTFDPDTHSFSILDNDYVTFTVPTGYTLSSLALATDSVIQPTDRLFLGIARGTSVSVDPSFTSASGLLGWTLVGASMIATNLVPALAASAPPDFPPIGGAGFTGPITSGQYTLWILDGDSPVTYDFKLDTVAAVPEPGSWALMIAGMALTGRALRRRAGSVSRPPASS